MIYEFTIDTYWDVVDLETDPAYYTNIPAELTVVVSIDGKYVERFYEATLTTKQGHHREYTDLYELEADFGDIDDLLATEIASLPYGDDDTKLGMYYEH